MSNVRQKTALLVGGGVTGIVNGTLGGGGGMIAVPLLRALAKTDTSTSHATAIAVILPASVVSAAIYLWKGLVPTSVLVPVAIGTFFGGYLGAKLLGKLPPRFLTFLFATVMLLAGIRSIV